MTSTNTAGNNTAPVSDEVELISLDALNARKLSAEAFEFNYIGPTGAATRIWFSILGDNAPQVRAAANELINEGRRTAATREANATTSADTVAPVEEDAAMVAQLAASRLVGWRGIIEDFNPTRALQLCQNNPHIAMQILAQSRRLENFIKV